MPRQAIEAYCDYELKRMYDANERFRAHLPEMVRLAKHPVLTAALEELVELHQLKKEGLVHALGQGLARVENAEAAAIAERGCFALEVEHPTVRDVQVAQFAVRFVHYEIASYTGLLAWYRQLSRDDVADTLAALVAKLQEVDRHLEDARAGLADLLPENTPHHKKRPRRPQERELHSELEGYERY